MLEKITQIIREYKGEEDLEITEDTTFESLGLDSLDFTQLLMEIEDAFGVSIELEDGPIRNISELIAALEKSDS